jgi:hypothetical protein
MAKPKSGPISRRAVLGGVTLTVVALVAATGAHAARPLESIIVTFKGTSGGWRRVRPALKGMRYRVRAVYRYTNQVAIDIEPRGVALLRGHPLVESVAPNGLSAPTLGAPR